MAESHNLPATPHTLQGLFIVDDFPKRSFLGVFLYYQAWILVPKATDVVFLGEPFWLDKACIRFCN